MPVFGIFCNNDLNIVFFPSAASASIAVSDEWKENINCNKNINNFSNVNHVKSRKTDSSIYLLKWKFISFK